MQYAEAAPSVGDRCGAGQTVDAQVVAASPGGLDAAPPAGCDLARPVVVQRRAGPVGVGPVGPSASR